MYLTRNATIGFMSSAVSDTCSNSIRVLKTCKQVSTKSTTYVDVYKNITTNQGISSLMFRGLGTKIISNGIQGMMFSILWRLGSDYLDKK